MTQYAPVSISVYDRESHLRECISSLLRNPEAAQTVLYIFSDAPQPNDEEKIARVRDYVRTITGFAEVRAVFQPDNSYARNMKQAREIPLHDFDRIIRMEDDIVVSPCFLGYMNEALDRYEHDPRIFGISGYAPDFGNSHPKTAFLSKDFSSWGFATWRDRSLSACVERRDYHAAMRRNPAARRAAARLHPLMLPMLRLVAQGKMNPGDYKLSAHQFLSGTFSVKPGSSLVRNIGFDGLGMGGDGARTSVFDTIISQRCPEFPDALEYDPEIDAAVFSVYFPKMAVETRLTALKLRLMGMLSMSLYSKVRNFKSRVRESLK
jgi:hypothetical protein